MRDVAHFGAETYTLEDILLTQRSQHYSETKTKVMEPLENEGGTAVAWAFIGTESFVSKTSLFNYLSVDLLHLLHMFS